MNEYKRLTTKCEVGIGLTETSGNIVNDYEKVINRLAELEDKIENSKLVELPCNVGDIVYFPTDDSWDYAEIDQIHIINNDIIFEWVQYDKSYEITEIWDDGEFSIHDIGKTVFLTRAEAEKCLKELQE